MAPREAQWMKAELFSHPNLEYQAQYCIDIYIIVSIHKAIRIFERKKCFFVFVTSISKYTIYYLQNPIWVSVLRYIGGYTVHPAIHFLLTAA